MTFKELARFFLRLESTTKRLELIEILSELFTAIETSEEGKKITYLIQGRVAAFYEPLEFGMGDRLIERAITLAYEGEIEKVHALNGKLGDLGLVAEEMAEKTGHRPNGLSIDALFALLQTITKTSGEGSVEGKVSLLSDILKHCDPNAAKFAVRIVSGRLRLGIGDPTVLEALSYARLGDRKYRKELERAYNEVSDLGLLAEVLWNYEGEKALAVIKTMTVSVGRPLRSELCERLPNAEKTIEKMGEVVSQFKYDGFRTQMHLDRKTGTVRLFSRNLEETTHSFPELIKGLMDQIDADSVILDSEALAYHPDSEEFFPFQETTKRRRKHGIEAMAEALPLRAFIFDILFKNGESLVHLPVTERLKILDATVKKNVDQDRVDTLIVSESRIISEAKPLGLMLEEALTKGLEGVVIKKVDSPYEAGGRNFNWVKLKHTASEQLKDTVDCVVLGYIFGRGKRVAFGVGALLVGLYDKERDVFVSVSKIGTGLSDAEWVAVRERCDTFVSKDKPARTESDIVPSVWVEPQVVIEVLADEITRSPSHTAGKTAAEPGYALRFPRLVSFRDADKNAEDATSVEEIKVLYSMQGKKE
ncbi:MAG: ATP-dependent DNA ligase [bacterium]|nr:ATP-dependent DNA ligase [bacterium]